jgi:hypothetical protein
MEEEVHHDTHEEDRGHHNYLDGTPEAEVPAVQTYWVDGRNGRWDRRRIDEATEVAFDGNAAEAGLGNDHAALHLAHRSREDGAEDDDTAHQDHPGGHRASHAEVGNVRPVHHDGVAEDHHDRRRNDGTDRVRSSCYYPFSRTPS